MSEGFKVTLDEPISIKKAAKITGYSPTHLRRFCQQYQDTRGESGLKSAKFGEGQTAPWYIEKSAAEDFKKVT